ncbi:Pentatricopeptide repeat-containing protein [Glycine soja]|uniref:Pentatricopeptide repeat-containing protein n=1 Tax=Glycine soja TaxID=3848 RepID=A0A445FVA1_GLYSO|nr:Pentatricopeptide repeat-containing protein [Glycine soja]
MAAPPSRHHHGGTTIAPCTTIATRSSGQFLYETVSSTEGTRCGSIVGLEVKGISELGFMIVKLAHAPLPIVQCHGGDSQMPLTPPSSQAPQSRKISPLHHVAANPALLLSHAPRIVAAIRYPFPEDMPLTLLKAYAKTRMPDEALHVFQTMPHVFGCSPTICSFNTLLNAFVESHQWARAENFFKYFEAASVTPNVETYNVLLKVLCKKGEFEKGRGLLTWMWGAGMSPDKITYRTLIGGVAKSGDLGFALEVFDEMRERGVELDVVCYNMIIDGFFKRGYFVKAGEMWERLLREESVFPSVGLFENGKVDKAMVLWDGLTEADSATYGVVIHGLCRNGYVNRALQVLEEAEHRGGGVDEFAYLSLINALCKEGRLDEAVEDALQLYSTMRQKNCVNLVTHNTIMEGFYKDGNCKMASKIWAHILEDKLQPGIILYNITLMGLSSCGRVTDAVGFLDDALGCGVLPTAITWNILVRAVIF